MASALSVVCLSAVSTFDVDDPCDQAFAFGPDRKLYISHYTGGRISRIEADGVDCIFSDRFKS